MHPIAATPFHLPRPSEAESGLWKSIRRRYEIRGIARWDGERLVLEWGGVVRVSESTGTASRSYEEPVDGGRCVVPIAELQSVELRGGWWLPCLEITTNALSSLAALPGAQGGRVCLRLSRQDRALAQQLRSMLRLAMAEHVLQAVERLPALGGGEGSPALPDRSGA